MLSNTLCGLGAHVRPFTIGDPNPEGSFVHVLDDTTVRILLSELDTISDFVDYLDAKERLLRSNILVWAAGEEELLAWYLTKIGPLGKHDFVWQDDRPTMVGLDEGHYDAYRNNPQRLRKVAANKISYEWDALIERFSHHAMAGTQYFKTGGLATSERILRVLAREPRVRRRVLARQLVKCVLTTPSHIRRTSVVAPTETSEPHYLFTMIPWDASRTERENREVRAEFLRRSCGVIRLVFPKARDVLGIATESGNDQPRRSEDIIYWDFSEWSEEDASEAREFQRVAEVLIAPKLTPIHEDEYPEKPTPPRMVGRNERCPCGSGAKYKRCHGRPGS